jgi:plastocyanin domain-containing protein
MLGSKFTKKMMKVSAVLVAVLGIIMLSRGFALSGVAFPSLSSVSAVSSSSSTAAAASVEDGVQNITSTLTSRGYPNITVQKGVPVVWNLKAGSSTLNGCNSTLTISKYGLQVKLKAGDNIIKFTPSESGTFTYSCWMGMQTGKITVVDDLGGQTAQKASDESAVSSNNTSSGGMSCCTGTSSN